MGDWGGRVDLEDHVTGRGDETIVQLLLIAADWQTRALLMAELQEAGYTVTALPGIRLALPALALGQLRPSLVVLDVTGDPAADAPSVERVLDQLDPIPVVLLAGAFTARHFEPLKGRAAAWLTRPFRVGDVVCAIQAILPPPEPAPC